MTFKTFLILLLAVSFGVLAPSSFSFAADVSRIENIGKNATSEGDAYRVTCSTGDVSILERRDGVWHVGVVLSGTGIPASESIDNAAKTYCGRQN
ncbi:MAG: hypothetical protein LBF22_06340 [Deltaproteobacteria bacterium]|jgi:hypothetical protein|nr:hypothetical protein [Deltaproteobacteria bacterium]